MVIARNSTEFISAVEKAVANQPTWDRIAAHDVAYKHTYFQRLANIFGVFGMFEDRTKCEKVATDLAAEHLKKLEEMYEH